MVAALLHPTTTRSRPRRQACFSPTFVNEREGARVANTNYGSTHTGNLYTSCAALGPETKRTIKCYDPMIPSIHFSDRPVDFVTIDQRVRAQFPNLQSIEDPLWKMTSRPKQEKAASMRRRKSTGSECQRSDGGYTENDILQGRGKGISRHAGNRRFRKIIRRHATAYARATCNYERRLVVDRVLSAVHEKGRFVELSEDSEDRWVVLSEKKIREKVSQALRYQHRSQNPDQEGESVYSSSSASDDDPSSADPMDVSSSGKPSEASEQLLGEREADPEADEALSALGDWNVEHSTNDTSNALISDEEILASIGEGHLVGPRPDRSHSWPDHRHAFG